MLVAAGCWQIWLARNRKLFRNSSSPPMELNRNIKRMLASCMSLVKEKDWSAVKASSERLEQRLIFNFLLFFLPPSLHFFLLIFPFPFFCNIFLLIIKIFYAYCKTTLESSLSSWHKEIAAIMQFVSNIMELYMQGEIGVSEFKKKKKDAHHCMQLIQ